MRQTIVRTEPSSVDRPSFTAHRALRIAEVITSVRLSDDDVKSVGELCRRSAIGLAPDTFRGWCRGEGVSSRAVLRFARVFRAVFLAARAGCSPAECLDADYRTVDVMFALGALSHLMSGQRITVEEFCVAQRYISNERIIECVLGLCPRAPGSS